MVTAAVEIGRRLARLATTHQVVVVTHLAQVAAFADRQLMVDKSSAVGGGVTRSAVRALDADARVVELARMLAGNEASETGRAHAEELLADAARDRARDRARARPAHPHHPGGGHAASPADGRSPSRVMLPARRPGPSPPFRDDRDMWCSCGWSA